MNQSHSNKDEALASGTAIDETTQLHTHQTPTRPLYLSFLKGIVYIVWCGGVASLGAIYGVTAYSFFMHVLSVGSGVMLTSFLVGVPLAMGFLVAYLAEKRKMRGVAMAGGLTMLSLSLFAFAVGALFREGIICLVMALVLFIPFMLLGALLSAIFSSTKPNHSGKLSAVMFVMPFAFGSVEQHFDATTVHQRTERSVYIEASPEKIWKLINFPLNIQASELEGGIAYKIGVPYPIEARTLEPKVGGKRQLVWQRGVRFEEEITEWQENRHIAWKYLFSPESFPSGALDDHVVIGGKYFDIEDTSYTLSPEGSGTRLTVKVGTRVTTHFNWYADFCARYLVSDTADTILNFYKQRAQGS
ncbi:SRPBCC family protein [Undibacterium fentianense]|uniref:SRPBCC family protein n=1 Tax=Undibacterium fentianense TaxID=2828728 RepID=A0A941IE67_9BURK|nr:SRPBCC family protein [Undibacterium fentianense]MBR7799321.1 SRPBCC family protein [Undibacterium fentianense]